MGVDLLITGQAATPPPASPDIFRTRAVVISGREVLKYAALLEEVAYRFGQYGAMNWLDYFLSGPSIRFKSPRLVLLVDPATDPETLRADAVLGCALFSEYVVCGVKTGAVVTEDSSGFRTVLAPTAYRAEVAARCAAELLQTGAQIVLVSYTGSQLESGSPVTKKGAMWTNRTRTLGTHLELQPRYEDTLARFNRTVRFRLGYFRRRLLSTTPCTFVPDVTTELTEASFLALNRGCLNPVSDDEATQRWKACQLPGGYAVGLRTNRGQWLAIIGGWRQKDTTVLHWQQNTSGYEKHSLTTVMRSYYLEHETARQAKRIVFFGGTPHSIRHYFPNEDVTDFMMRRTTLRARWMMRLAAQFATRGRTVRKPNFLADALSDESLRWLPTASPATRLERRTAPRPSGLGASAVRQ